MIKCYNSVWMEWPLASWKRRFLCQNEISFRTEHALCCFWNGSVLQWMGSAGWNSQSIQSPHTLPHIRLIHPDWVKMGVDAAGQQPVLCVCVRVCEMCKCQPSLEIDLSAEKRFFQPYSFSSCISLTAVTGHFISVFPPWWIPPIWPLKIWTEAVFTHTHTTVIQRPEEFGSRVWECVLVLGSYVSLFFSFFHFSLSHLPLSPSLSS